jgi:hypothetical protein
VKRVRLQDMSVHQAPCDDDAVDDSFAVDIPVLVRVLVLVLPRHDALDLGPRRAPKGREVQHSTRASPL